MRKTELYKVVSEETEKLIKEKGDEGFYSQQAVEEILTAFANVVLKELKETSDDSAKVPFPGIGNFYKKHVPERTGVSKLHGDKEWVRPAHNQLCFKISSAVKEI